MANKKLILTFPPGLTNKPVTYILGVRFNLQLNILRANIVPQGGKLVLGVTGEDEDIQKGIDYLKENSVDVQFLHENVLWDDEKCTGCSMCTSVCPTDALYLDRNTWRIEFDGKKCIACEMCLDACPAKAITISVW